MVLGMTVRAKNKIATGISPIGIGPKLSHKLVYSTVGKYFEIE